MMYFFYYLIEYFLLSAVVFIFNLFKNILIFTYLVILKTILLSYSSVITREWIRRDAIPLIYVEFYFVAYHTFLLSMHASKHPLYLLATGCCVWLPFYSTCTGMFACCLQDRGLETMPTSLLVHDTTSG